MSSKPVDYYAILEVSPTATSEQIRTAYKKAALRWHPDRVPTDSPERATRTKKFQQINDAYFTLSDTTRRRDYDAARQFEDGDFASESADEDIPNAQPKKGWFGWGKGSAQRQEGYEKTQWNDVFEEMMRDTELGEEKDDQGKKRTMPNLRLWTSIGMVSGASLGFIVGGPWAAIAGGGVGAKAGAIRDTHGKSVYEVFQELPQADRAKVLTELATRLFAQALSA